MAKGWKPPGNFLIFWVLTTITLNSGGARKELKTIFKKINNCFSPEPALVAAFDTSQMMSACIATL
jgi:hypothetical protein